MARGPAKCGGTQLGLAISVVLVVLGLASLIAALHAWFLWLRLVGAVYPIFLDMRLLTAPDDLQTDAPPRSPHGGFFLALR
jgi:homoserine/homoserine lactone efflux protein